MIDLDDARRRSLEPIRELPPREAPLAEALGLVLREPLHSRWPLPVHDNSAMDGYGLRCADLREASSARPVELDIVGIAAPGQPFAGTVEAGQAVRILTGARIPAGVDSVVRQEDVELDGQRVRFSAPTSLANNIRRRGEDVETGVELLPAGTIIDPDVVMALASFGCDPVTVSRTPKVAIVTCGDELVAVREASGSEVVDIAGPTIAACCQEAGATPALFGPARDTLESLRETIAAARASAPDLLITIGGASVGDRDLVAPVLDECGIDWAFARVKIKPGKPTGFGMIAELPVFVLPGNPGAARVVFAQLVAPALARMQGKQALTTQRSAITKVALERDGKRATVVQVHAREVGGRLHVERQQANSSSRISPTLHANASFVVPAGSTPLASGSVVDIELRRPASRRAPAPVLAFVGLSGSGKTSLLAQLITLLCDVPDNPATSAIEGRMRVGVIKHGRHFDVDRPGKDSDRFRVAGAAAVVMASERFVATLEHESATASFAELRWRLPDELDLILVEGFKHEGLPSIEVHRDDRPLLCTQPGFGHVIALVTNNPRVAPPGLPCYDPGELEPLAELARRMVAERDG